MQLLTTSNRIWPPHLGRIGIPKGGVGYFDSRESAEPVYQSLMRQEDYRDAYSTSN
jgi:hypothetical protein